MISPADSKAIAWLKLARPQFYPAAWVCYSLGAALAYRSGLSIDWTVGLLGCACITLLELATVLCNEYFDLRADLLNANASLFTGGSRVLVSGRIGLPELRTGIAAVLGLILLGGYALFRTFRAGPAVLIVPLLFSGLFLGLGYTLPPFRFSYRGLGELVVALTFGPYLVLSGFFLQSGTLNRGEAWLFSVPLFLAILPAIILAGVPDRSSDMAAAKRTLVVRLGVRKSCLLALGFAAAAAAAAAMLWVLDAVSALAGLTLLLAIPHCAALGAAVLRFLRSGNLQRRINPIMLLALSYILWFCAVPLLDLILHG